MKFPDGIFLSFCFLSDFIFLWLCLILCVCKRGDFCLRRDGVEREGLRVLNFLLIAAKVLLIELQKTTALCNSQK